ncbi:MAG: NAD-dependent epimerase/dehydratase family protein [Methylacidiphilales bacterium]|nr:NAD-dependent epimerase/dehydratase family protein [Candidatus Methylacidiphilales bacterium]
MLPVTCHSSPSRILITGICGFVGSTLAMELRKAWPELKIHGIDNLIRKGSAGNVERLRAAGCEVRVGDVRNPQDLEKMPAVDWVLDCAANPSVLAGLDGKSSSFEVMDHNLIGTIRLLEYCKSHRAGFLLLSTSRVYSIAALSAIPVEERNGAFVPRMEVSSGRLQVKARCLSPVTCHMSHVTVEGITEDFSTAPPLSFYGVSKLCSESLALEYGETFGFPVWINRCGVLAGAGQFGRADQGIFAYWINSWLRKRPLKYIGFGGEGFQVRDCLHPKDLAPLLIRQMREPDRKVCPIQHLAGGSANSMSLRQLSDWCAKRFGPHQVASDPKPRPFDLPWMVLDSSRAGRQWGWEPQTAIHDILEEIALHAEAHPDWLEVSGA